MASHASKWNSGKILPSDPEITGTALRMQGMRLFTFLHQISAYKCNNCECIVPGTGTVDWH